MKYAIDCLIDGVEPYNSDPIEEDFVQCPSCGYASHPMGTLGNLQHFRCRACGIDYNREVSDE